MFARVVSMQLKPNASKSFSQVFEKQIIPTLKKQKGFKDEMFFEVLGAPEALAISIWESKEHAEAYERGAYREVLQALTGLVEKDPVVKTYALAYSTFHKWRGPSMFPTQSPITTTVPGVGGG